MQSRRASVLQSASHKRSHDMLGTPQMSAVPASANSDHGTTTPPPAPDKVDSLISQR